MGSISLLELVFRDFTQLQIKIKIIKNNSVWEAISQSISSM